MDDEQDPLVVGILTLLYALPPQDTEENVITTCQLAGDTNIADKVLRRIQRPSKLIYDSVAGRYFLGSDYNKIAAYYRSPFSNGFFTKDGSAVPDSDVPQNDKRIRPNVKHIEEYLNESFEVYRRARYPSGVSSVYFWDIVEGEGWCAAILFRNSLLLKDVENDHQEFTWDSVNVIMQIPRSNQYIYRIKTTIFLTLRMKSSLIGKASWGGRVIKNTTTSRTVGDNAPTIYEDSRSQAEYLSALVEEHEKALAYQLREVSLPKTRQAINALRLINPFHAQVHAEISEKLNASAFREDKRSESRVGSIVGSNTIPRGRENGAQADHTSPRGKDEGAQAPHTSLSALGVIEPPTQT